MKTLNFIIACVGIMMAAACAQTPQQTEEQNAVIETIMASATTSRFRWDVIH